MEASARVETATWRPTGPKTRPFRFGLGPGAQADPELRPGDLVGDRYRILGTLGAGGPRLEVATGDGSIELRDAR